MTEDEPTLEDGDADGAAVSSDLAVPALASGIGAAAGYYAGGAGGAALGAAAAPYLARFFQKSVNALWADRMRRAENMMQAAGEAAGLSPDQFAERADQSEKTRFLTDMAVQAAADSIWPAGVRAIGRALAAGLLATDKPAMDLRQRVVGVMKDLDELHVTLLDLLVRYEPDWTSDAIVAIPHRIPSHVNIYMAGDGLGNPKVWSIGRRKWTVRQICAVRPHLQPVLPSLLGTLQQQGLAAENDTSPEMAKQLGKDLVQQINRQAGQAQHAGRQAAITLRETSLRDVRPSWSPTELGEQALGFYVEAGTEDSPTGR